MNKDSETRRRLSAYLKDRFWSAQVAAGKQILQREWAEQIGVEAPTLNQWMSGARLPEGENVGKLAAVAGDAVYDILGLMRPDPMLRDMQLRWDALSPAARRAIYDVYIRERERAGEGVAVDVDTSGGESEG